MGIKKDKLNEDQKKELERLRHFASRNRLNSQMNGTKWRAAIDAITSIPEYPPRFRFKLITDKDDPSLQAWDENFPEGIPLYNSIEWLEFNPWPITANRSEQQRERFNFSAKLKSQLSLVQIPIVETPTGIRIVAYTRPK